MAQLTTLYLGTVDADARRLIGCLITDCFQQIILQDQMSHQIAQNVQTIPIAIPYCKMQFHIKHQFFPSRSSMMRRRWWLNSGCAVQSGCLSLRPALASTLSCHHPTCDQLLKSRTIIKAAPRHEGVLQHASGFRLPLTTDFQRSI